MSVDGVVLVDGNKNVLEGKLERQQEVSKGIGLIINKTEFLEFWFENEIGRNGRYRKCKTRRSTLFGKVQRFEY